MTKIATPTPHAATTHPAAAGPMARAIVNCTELSLTACSISSSGTRSGTNVCHAEVWNPVAQPLRMPRPMIHHGVMWPVV